MNIAGFFHIKTSKNLYRLPIIAAAAYLVCATSSATAAVIDTDVEKTKEKLTITTPAGAYGNFKLSATSAKSYTITSTDVALTEFTGKGDCTPGNDLTTVECIVKENASPVKTIIIKTADKNDDISVDLYNDEFPNYDKDLKLTPLDIDSGDGNDTLIVNTSRVYNDGGRLEKSAITTGKGNDTVNAALKDANAVLSDQNHLPVKLGDGNDTFQAKDTTAIPFDVYQGQGNDRIFGSNAWLYHRRNYTAFAYFEDVITDRFISESTADGDDLFESPISGGGATVSYENRTSKVNVTLDGKDNDGDTAAGEKDNVRESISGVIGGSGNDNINVDLTTVTTTVYTDIPRRVNGGAGEDTLSGTDPGATMHGRFDCMSSYSRYFVLLGGPDNDVITGTKNQTCFESLQGGSGNDTINGNNHGPDLSWSIQTELLGESGNDTLTASDGGRAWLIGGDGDDTMIGNNGDNSYFLSSPTGAAEGKDTVQDLGTDPGDVDSISYNDAYMHTERSRTTSVSITLDGTANDGEAGEGDNIYPGIESITGGNGDDTISEPIAEINGVGGNDTLSNATKLNGGKGEDTLTAKPGVASTLIGDNGNDVLTGKDGDDAIDGGNGNDTIKGGEGNNSLGGGNDQDTLTAGSGNDELYGGSGNDRLEAGQGNNTLEGDYGDDILVAGDGNDILKGDNGNDDLQANNGINTLDGGDNDDQLTSGNQDDQLTGGSGNDTLKAGQGNNRLSGDPGNDLITAGDGDDALDGAADDDQLNAGQGNNTVTGGDGNDTLTAGDGDDTLTGGNGNDTLEANNGTNTLNAGDGNDTLTSGAGNDTLVDSDGGSDTLTAGDGNNILTLTNSRVTDSDRYTTGSGNDLITTQPGSADYKGSISIKSGDGDDIVKFPETLDSRVESGGGNDTVTAREASAGDGNDLLSQSLQKSTPGTYTLDGGNGDDQLYGAQATVCDQVVNDVTDRLLGGNGNDTLIAGDGADMLEGGAGDDKMNSDTSCKGEISANPKTYQSDSATESIDAGDGNDFIISQSSNQTQAGDGDDSIVLYQGIQAISGDVYGGNGSDTISYPGDSRYYPTFCSVQVSLDDQANDGDHSPASPTPSFRHNTHSDVENINGGDCSDDLLVGSDKANIIYGQPGYYRKGTIIGGKGEDILSSAYTIDARDGEHDEVICRPPGLFDGKPYGEAQVDQHDNVTNCEKTTRETFTPDRKNAKCTVINVTGKGSDEATSTLTKNYCAVMRQTWWTTLKRFHNRVLGQSLKPGTYQQNTTVTLKIGKLATKRSCRIPRLKGKTLTTVNKVFAKVQCNLNLRYKRTKNKRYYGKVIAQSKRGTIHSGTTVTVTIGTKR